MIEDRGGFCAGKRIACVSITAAIAVLAGATTAAAQDDQVQHRLPAFQAPASDSLETEVLARLNRTGEYLPDDLPRLARLAVLESISMLVNVRADLRGSLTGNQLEEQVTAVLERLAGVLRLCDDRTKRRRGEHGACGGAARVC